MPECNYCGASFDDERSYLEHLDSVHEEALGTIDRRRIAEGLDGDDDGGFGLAVGPLVLGTVLLIAVALVVYVVFFVGGNGATTVNGFDVAQTPGTVGTVHEHGLMNVTIDGQRIDFSQPRYQYSRTQFDAFHFEGGNGRVWHKHAPDVTLEYAMATLGIGVSEGTVTVEGTTYRESDPGTNVTVTVDGEPVTASEYVLQGVSASNPEQGDVVRIVVTTG